MSEKEQRSIHPRVWMKNGRQHMPLNTCKPRADKRHAFLAVPGMTRHCEEHPADEMSRKRLAKLKQML